MTCDNKVKVFNSQVLALRSATVDDSGIKNCAVPSSTSLRQHLLEGENRGLSTIYIELTTRAMNGRVTFGQKPQGQWTTRLVMPPSQGKSPGANSDKISLLGVSPNNKETITTTGTADYFWRRNAPIGPIHIIVDVVP